MSTTGPTNPQTPLTADQIHTLVHKQDLAIQTMGARRVRFLISDGKTHKMSELVQTLLTELNKPEGNKEKHIEASEKLLEMYDKSDPTASYKISVRKELKAKIAELNRQHLLSYLGLNTNARTTLDEMARGLLEKQEALLKNPQATSKEIRDLILCTKKLLKLYKTKGYYFREHPKAIELRNKIFNPPLATYKTTGIFSRIFSSAPPEPDIDTARKATYNMNLGLRRALDHKRLTALEVKLEHLEQAEMAQKQFELEQSEEVAFKPENTGLANYLLLKDKCDAVLQITIDEIDQFNINDLYKCVAEVIYLYDTNTKASISQETSNNLINKMLLHLQRLLAKIPQEKQNNPEIHADCQTEISNRIRSDLNDTPLTAIPLILPDTQENIVKFLDKIVDAHKETEPLAQVAIDAVTYVTTRETDLGKHKVASCETTGTNEKYLKTMEDKLLTSDFTINVGGRDYPIVLAGVFDGHGGALAATYARHFYPTMLQKRLEQCRPDLTPEEITNALTLTTVDLHQAWCVYCKQKMEQLQNQLDQATLETDKKAIIAKKQQLKAGTTASVLLQINGDWYTANVGDSRIILVPPEGGIQQVTADHTPENQEEEITQRDGIFDPRHKDTFSGRELDDDYDVDRDESSCGRSIGDAYVGSHTKGAHESLMWNLGDQGVNPRSSVQRIQGDKVQKGYRFAIASDGFYENKKDTKVANSATIGTFIQDNPNAPISAVATAATRGVINAGSYDNCSMIILEVGG
jgi:serine/threonine protein phosphatase PrpC